MTSLAERLDSFPEAWQPKAAGEKLIGEQLDLYSSLVDFTVSYFSRIERLLEEADRDDEAHDSLVATAEEAWKIHFELDYVLDRFTQGVRDVGKADNLVSSLYLNLIEREGRGPDRFRPLREAFQQRLDAIMDETLAEGQEASTDV